MYEALAPILASCVPVRTGCRPVRKTTRVGVQDVEDVGLAAVPLTDLGQPGVDHLIVRSPAVPVLRLEDGELGVMDDAGLTGRT